MTGEVKPSQQFPAHLAFAVIFMASSLRLATPRALAEAVPNSLASTGTLLGTSANAAGSGPNGWLPQTLAIGSLGLSPLTLTPTLYIQLDGFGEGNSGWGGHFAPPLEESRFFLENAIEPGLDSDFELGRYGRISGRISAIFAMTTGGLNAAATNYGDIQAHDFSIEDGYAEWSSGALFPGLGEDALQLIGGRYTYRIGDGFLFYNGATGGGNKVTAWLAPHHAFRQSAIASLNSHGLLLEGFYLNPNDHPDTHTELAGINTELRMLETIRMGLTYASIFHSDTPRRQGLNVIYWRAEGAVLPSIKDFYLAASFVTDSNGDRVSGAYGWYITPSYTFSRIPWQPTLYYRYASFSGGGPGGNHNFDPLFYGMSDWGTWYQGEILGNWIASNSNLNSHQVRVNLAPSDEISVNLIYYHFMLASLTQDLVAKPAEPLTSKNLADEANLIVGFNLANWWSMALTFAVNVPGCAARQISGGSETWFQTAIWSGWSF